MHVETVELTYCDSLAINLLSSGHATLGVVPVLVGPLQVLLVLLLGMIGLLGGVILAAFRPATAKKTLRILWRQKLCVAATVVVVIAAVPLLRLVRAAHRAEIGAVEECAADWPMFRGGPQRLGAAAADAAPTQGGLLWNFADDDKTFYSSAAVVGNRLYVTSAEKGVFRDHGAIYCLDADSGGLVWKSAPKGYRATFSSPVVCGKYLVCGEGLHFTRDARILCLDVTHDGRLLWEQRTKSHVESSPCIAGDRVYVGAGDDGIYCLTLAPDDTGAARVLWHVEGQRCPDAESSPVAEDGRVYVELGMGGRAVCCLDAANGNELWRVPTPYPVFAAPTLARGKLLVGMGNGNFIETAEEVRAKELKRLAASGASAAQIAAAGEQLALGGAVWCLDAATGAVQWRFPLEQTVLGTVAAGPDALFVASSDGHLYRITYDGRPCGKWNSHAPVVTSPALASKFVYFVAAGGMLHALRADSLDPVWELSLGASGPFLSSPTVARGHVYVGSAQSGFLCLGTPGDQQRTLVVRDGFSPSSDAEMLPDRGEISWRYPARGAATGAAAEPMRVQGPVACLNGRLYVPLAAGPRKGLACLAADSHPDGTPSEIWFAETANGVSLSPAVTASVAVFVDGARGAAGRAIRAVDVTSGEERWQSPVSAEVSGEFTIAASAAFVQDIAETISSVGLADAAVLWRQRVGELAAAPKCADAILVAALLRPPALTAMDLPSGERLWRTPLGATPTTRPVIRGDRVYLGTSAGIAAFRLQNGQQLWSSTEGGVECAFAIDGQRIAYVGAQGDVVVIEAEDGKPVARLAGALPVAPPLLRGDTVWYASRYGIIAHDLGAGRGRRWVGAAGWGELLSPLVAADGRMYFATEKAGLVCVCAAR